jgi:hypothetical protein
MRLTAKIYKADTPNLNGVIYPKDELESAIEKFNNSERVVKIKTNSENDKAIGLCHLSMIEDYVIANLETSDKHDQPLKSLLDNNVDVNLMPVAYAQVLQTEDNQTTTVNMNIVSLTCTPEPVGYKTDMFKLKKLDEYE